MSQRILVLSDTHGDVSAMREAMPMIRALAPHYIYHLGDVVEDGIWLRTAVGNAPLYAVRGNCDFSTTEPLFRTETVENVSMFLTHGHHYDVKSGFEKLCHGAEAAHCSCVLFGHTHMPMVEHEDGLLLVNPGSLSRPRQGRKGTMALLMVDGAKVEASILTI